MKLRFCMAGLALALTVSQSGYAVSESLLDEYDAKVKEYFDVGSGGTYKSFDGTEVGYWALGGSGRPIILITGLGEAFDHYQETAYDLRTLERPIYILELRSQGHGDRLSSVHRDIYYLNSFDDYYKDLETFVRQYVDTEEGIDVIAHSTGTYPAIRYAADYPQNVRQLILSAPLVEVELGWVPRWLASTLASSFCLVGMCDDFVLTANKYNRASYKYEGNLLTNSEPRFNRIFDVIEANPVIKSGGPSNRWLQEALAIPDAYESIAEKVTPPVLILTADNDGFSKPEGQTKLCKQMPQCEQIIFEDSRHVLLHEVDRVRNVVFKRITERLMKE